MQTNALTFSFNVQLMQKDLANTINGHAFKINKIHLFLKSVEKLIESEN